MVKKTIEETYQKLTQREHVLLRSGMYIGSVKKQMEELWVPDAETYMMKKKIVEYSPGFMKIFDEVLTNATDHSFRHPEVTQIKINYDQETGEVSVYNNGPGIPVELHKEHNMYVPELIFGHMLSGSNYDDTDSRTGSGTNGLGSKCTNIFSKKFIIETVDSNSSKKFVQEHSENMTMKSKAKITSNSKSSYTKITFIPDYQRFDMQGLEDDTISLINKRAIDCIACTASTVKIYLNGDLLKGKGMLDYTKYYFHEAKVYNESFIEKVKNKKGEFIEYIWEYTIVPSEYYEQVSFVNGNATNQGGKHVDYIMYQIINKLKVMLETKKKLKELKPNFIKDKLFLFLRATVANPTFNSQTKEQLTTASKDFGCVVQVSDKFIERLYKSSITEEIVEFCKAKESIALAKTTDGSKKNRIFLPKLEDAIKAGTNQSNKCSLILTEGLSALTFALHGRSVVGPDYIGAYPLRGKCNSEDTNIPLFNGEIKLAKDIQIGDILIGDDGNKRTVLTLYKGNGKMYEISQDRGESYKVNNEHILTLCIPEHKIIYWNEARLCWRTIYWDKIIKNIKAKEIQTCIKIKCNDCEMNMNINCLKRHYSRQHKNLKYTKPNIVINMNDTIVVDARKKLEEFLSNIDNNNIIDICIQDYFNVTKSFQRKLKGIRGECVNWEEKNIELDPYILGLWLGDGGASGYSYTCDGENDYQIMDYLHKWGENNDAKFKKVNSTKYNYSISSIDNFRKMGEAPLKKILEKYNVIKNKHIPKEYLVNSKEIRLKLLAGIIDSDGFITPDGTIEISQSVKKHTQLAQDIVYLSRSLGFYTYLKKKVTNYTYKKSGEKAEAYIIKISGDTEEIPNILLRKKSKSTSQYNIRKSTGIIKIKSINNQNYVGIGIDRNNRFLINDFTVTHNCLNVRDATIQQLTNNEEICNIKHILGLKEGKVYKNTDELRYGKVILLTDSDCDGSHIKALLINIFSFGWPSLLKLNPSFIQTIKTPILKAVKGKQIVEFFTEQDYHKWVNSSTNTNSYKIKYFKGLGSSTKEDAKDIFKRLGDLRVDYYYKDEKCKESILLAFDKDKNTVKLKKKEKEEEDTETDDGSEIQETNAVVKCSDRRKQWLSNYDKNSYIDMKQTKISFQELINKELIHFSIYDNSRSIPSLCDGLKPSQRKILHYMLKKNITDVIKVAQLSGYVSAECGYHHGEVSLQGAIIGMAQDYTGSNNINLLYPDGNFGCLDPETDILMWSGNIKKAKNIKIGDKLIGDDGMERNVLDLIQGRSNMYEIELSNGDKYTVNEDHILTLRYSGHKKIFWRNSDKSWRVNYFDNIEMKSKSKSFRTNMSTKNNHFNMSKLIKKEAYEKILIFTNTINFPEIIDIKLSDYLKLDTTTKNLLYSVKNNVAINWLQKILPINPYILGMWLGDGNSDGSGLTSADEEIIKEFVYFADTINSELVHDKNGIETKNSKYKIIGEIHENYHYGIRQKKSKNNKAKRISIGNFLHHSDTCLGCISSNKKSPICNFHFEKSEYIENYCVRENKNGSKIKRNPWKELLINNNLYKNKHIPIDYIYNSKENRLQLLAGFIDTDGSVRIKNNIPKIEISQSNRLRKELIIQLKFICELF